MSPDRRTQPTLRLWLALIVALWGLGGGCLGDDDDGQGADEAGALAAGQEPRDLPGAGADVDDSRRAMATDPGGAAGGAATPGADAGPTGDGDGGGGGDSDTDAATATGDGDGDMGGGDGDSGDGEGDGDTGGGDGDAGDGDAGDGDAGDGDAGTPDPEPGRLAGFTAAHNAVRAMLSDEREAEPALPELSWSTELAEYAQQWADVLAADCGVLEHRDQDTYGENLSLYASWPTPPQAGPEEVVWGWADERSCYVPGPFLDGDGCDLACTTALNASGCGHYTQVVWRDTTQVGCGVASCTFGSNLVDVWVCNYSPAGNIVSQLPY